MIRDKLKRGLYKIKNFNEYIQLITDYGLKVTDLYRYGILSKNKYYSFRNIFKNKEDSSQLWKDFKKSHLAFYYYIIVNTDIVFCNKRNK